MQLRKVVVFGSEQKKNKGVGLGHMFNPDRRESDET